MKNFTKVIIIFLCLWSVGKTTAQSVGGTTSGANTYCSFTNAGFISLSGFTGTTYFWESSTDGVTWSSTGTSWAGSTTPFVNPPALGQSYNNLSQTTCYRAIVTNGASAPDTSTVSCVTVFAPTVAGTISGGGNFCGNSGNGNITLTGNTGAPTSWEYSTDNGITWTTVSNTGTSLPYSGITQATIYQAIVQNGSTCPSDTTNTVSFTIDSLSNAGTISGNDTVCYGTNAGALSITGITGTVVGWISSADSGMSWNPLSNTGTSHTYANLTQSTLYGAIVKNNSCPADTSAFSLIAVRNPVLADAGNDTSVQAGQMVTLNGTAGGFSIWTPATGLSNQYVLNPDAQPAVTTVYTLTVTDSIGCTGSDNVIISIIPEEFNGMVSNLFTPNGDGINDSWYIQDIQNFPGSSVTVYNIYGMKVYEKTDYMNDWKGTYNGAELPDGTYYFVLKFSDDQKSIKGSVDILKNK
jgi:gliding motility-associated-like protein